MCFKYIYLGEKLDYESTNIRKMQRKHMYMFYGSEFLEEHF